METEPISIKPVQQHAGIHRILILIGFILYGTLLGIQQYTVDNAIAMLGVAVVIYVLSIYLYFGVEVTAFFGQYIYITVSAVAALGLGFALLQANQPQMLLSLVPIGAIALSGTVGGMLTARFRPRLQVLLAGAAVVVLFYAIQYAPLWRELMENAQSLVQALMQDAQTQLAGVSGMSAMDQSVQLDIMKQALELIVRLIPAFSLLSVVLMFVMAHLLFLRRASRVDARHTARSFIFWKMPFVVTPVVIAAIAIRFIENDTVQLIADNALFMLAFGYCMMGLALLEYGMQKIGAGIFMRVSLYLLLFVTQVFGLFAMSLLGFVDSFADWRKVDGDDQPRAATHEVK